MEITISKDNSLIPNQESLSVEHILPKKPGAKWPTRMRTTEFLKEHIYKIGNLTILTEPMNRDWESKEFSFKKTIYKDSKYELTKNLCQVSDWSETEIEKRQADLAELAASAWVI